MYTKKQKRKYANNLKSKATRGEKSIRLGMWLIGYKFQAYDPTGYLPDYYCHISRVALEVDGSVHKGIQKKVDRHKDKVRRRNKIYTMRVSDWYAYWFPALVIIEAGLTSMIYSLWRTTGKLINKR